jgi:predicted nuclease of restriction endonuclease-like RecB superfamily
MLKLSDLRKTTRRASSGNGRTLHPHFLRDQSLSPRIGMAIAYLESMLGRPRRELDQEVVVQLFGDHKLAHCIVACLASSYRHCCRTFDEALPPEQVEVLGKRGITAPSELRLWLFHQANACLPGFVGGTERVPFLRQAGAVLGLEIEQIEMLITLDSPEQAILVRVGPRPTPADVIARFNYHTVAAVLANAPEVRLSLASAPHNAGIIRELCALAGVRAELAGRELVLHGQQDVLDGWARYGAKLVRLLVSLLACGLPVRTGEAVVAAPDGDQWRFRLTAEVFAYLGQRDSETGASFALADLLECWRTQDTIMADFASARRSRNGDGWLLRRAIEPLVLDGAVLPSLFVAQRGNQRVPLILAPASEIGTSHLAGLAARHPLVTLRIASDGHAGAQEIKPVSPLLRLTYAQRRDMMQLPTLLGQAVGEVEERSAAQRLEAVFEEASDAGVLTEQQLAERLACDSEEVPAVLARPETRALAKTYNMHYVEGFGLCATQVLMRARAAARDVVNRRDWADSTLQVMRQLSRRLREVTGASEGIECLIAYLGAA